MLKDEYGVVTELYAYIAIFFVILLYGMETTFFRFAEKEKSRTGIFYIADQHFHNLFFVFYIGLDFCKSHFRIARIS